jgi:hypothetical protein
MQQSLRPVMARTLPIRWPENGIAYRLVAIAPTVRDVVEAAGGWLFDRARCGWKVETVIVDAITSADALSLKILGVERVAPLRASSLEILHRAAALAICGGMLEGTTMLSKRVQALLQHSATEVVVWGSAPARLQQQSEEVRHAPFSAASRVFKARALMAGGFAVAGSLEPSETFFRIVPPTLRYRSDLVPAAK